MVTKTNILDTVKFDADGYLVSAADWTPELAEAIAETLDVTLNERHWVVINYARKEFEANGDAPSLRKITKETDVNTKELYALFPGGAAKVAAKIAGLKKPTGCL